MSRRLSLYVNVAIVALAAAGIVVGLVLDTRTTPTQPPVYQGKPPVPVGLPAPYGPTIEAAFRNWPNGSIDTMQRLGLQYFGTPCGRNAFAPPPCADATVQYYRGLALLFAGYPADAQSAFESAKSLGMNTVIQGKADMLLHPTYFQPSTGASYPVFVPTKPNRLLTEGSKLQAEGHQLSAERVYVRAARLSPNDDEAQVAVAVGLFDEGNLVPAFSHLGPLTKRFPKSQAVRYYLGYLLAWTAQGSTAIPQFEKVVQLGPSTPLGKAAAQFLAGLSKGTPAPASK